MRRNTLTVLKKSNVYFQLIKIKFPRLWVLESPVQTDTTLLANNSQHCWMLHVASVCTPLPTRTQQLPKLLVQHCWELLHPFEHHCQQGRNNSLHFKSRLSLIVRLNVVLNRTVEQGAYKAKTFLSDARQPEVRPSPFLSALALTNLYG